MNSNSVNQTKCQKKQRIDYIDLMKGFCIMLVVLGHCNYKFPIEAVNIMLEDMRMPMYFCLSGLFFKKYSCFGDFFIRKINKLIVPFLFFCFFPRIFYPLIFKDKEYSIDFLINVLLVSDGEPIWFLRCLFITYIFYYAFVSLTEKLPELIQWVFLVLITLAVYYASNELRIYQVEENKNIVVYSCYLFQLFTVFMMLPFFHLCQYLRKREILVVDIKKSVLLLLMLIFCILWYLFKTEDVSLLWCSYGNNYVLFYLSALSGIGCLWAICMFFRHIPIVSYWGRYSIMILCTHKIIIKILQIFLADELLTWVLTMLIMLPCIIFMKKYLPYFTAQKDLFKYK